ncbi:LysR family transcriptional regulator [Agrobacterium vitis]|nr:LysR family transcriptional regulator [Agrobacterium vitis]MUZ99650.1 LysR family transcriptional regulator [Agrobacterium vitis]NOJ37608.1 LysR family transcriptional regulator [Agrobacterium vitis]RCU51294.1 LysR family transcriptional regulator [Agrobacterium vitis]
MSDLLNLNRLIFFTAVVEAGSFTAAADRMGVAKAVVSHQIARLEEELGVTLLMRTTRRLHATEDGKLFYQRCVLILREAEAAYGEMSLRNAEPSGTLTLTAPLDYGAAVVAPTIAEYRKANPQMHVDVIFDDSVSDLIAEKIDLSIRVGWLSDSSHQARRLGTFEQILVATPAVASGIAANLAPADVAHLPWIANRALRNALRWTFSRGKEETVTVEAQPTVTTDKTPTAYACMAAGVGVAVFPDYMVEADVRAGKLVHRHCKLNASKAGFWIMSLVQATRRRAIWCHFSMAIARSSR